jgi:hypothetical protein
MRHTRSQWCRLRADGNWQSGVTQLLDAQAERRDLVECVLALDPMIEQTLGESSHARYRSRYCRMSSPRLLADKTAKVLIFQQEGSGAENAKAIEAPN